MSAELATSCPEVLPDRGTRCDLLINPNGIRYGKGLRAFGSEPREWDQLRSHDSTVGRGSRIVYTVETRDTSAFTMILSLRYDL